MRRLACGGLLIGSVAAVVAVLLLSHQPAFYRRRVAAAAGDDVRARRLVTKASALHADLLRPGPWQAAIGEQELNAWLATDLPRNHPGLLPAWMAAPRVAFSPRRVRAGWRLAVGPASVVASCEAEVTLRGADQLVVAVHRARLGGLPIPRGPAVHEIDRCIRALGLPTELRRLDGQTLIVVYTSAGQSARAPHRRLETFAVEPGELLAAGVGVAATDR